MPGVDDTPAPSLEGVTPSLTYYVGSTASGTPLAGAPTDAGTYTVVANFAGSADYASGSAPATFTVARATPTISWAGPAAIAFFTPLSGSQLNAVANVPGTFVYTPPAGTLLTAGTQTLSATFTPTAATDYNSATATVPIVVLGRGVTVIGTQLYLVGGKTTSDQVQVNATGNSNTGSSGVTVSATLNGVNTESTYSQSFTTIDIFLLGGNHNIEFANGLTINAVVTAGDGNNNIQLGNGNSSVTLGNGNDNIQAGNGSNTVVAGNGNDNVQLGNGNYDNVTMGSGNDNVQIGNGSYNTVTLPGTGSGHDNVKFGNGTDNTID